MSYFPDAHTFRNQENKFAKKVTYSTILESTVCYKTQLRTCTFLDCQICCNQSISGIVPWLNKHPEWHFYFISLRWLWNKPSFPSLNHWQDLILHVSKTNFSTISSKLIYGSFYEDSGSNLCFDFSQQKIYSQFTLSGGVNPGSLWNALNLHVNHDITQ